MLIFLKAKLPGGAAGDLFAQTVTVHGHMRGATFVAPHQATRQKRLDAMKQRRDPDRREPDLFSAPPPKPAAPAPVQSPPKIPETPPKPADQQDRITYGDLPPDMQDLLFQWRDDEELPEDHAFPVRRVALADLPQPPFDAGAADRGASYALAMPRDLPPIMVAHGHFLDGRHRAFAARARGDTHISTIDLSGVIAADVAAFNSMGAVATAAAPAERAAPNQVAAAAGRDVARRTSQAAKLREMAQRDKDAAEADAGRDRNTNTHRRARMAAGAIEAANGRARIAETMLALADAIEWGEAKHLAGVSTRAHVELLDTALRRGMWSRDSKLTTYEQNRREGRAAEPDDIRAARLPDLAIHPTHVATIARKLRADPKQERLARRVEALPHSSDDMTPVPEDLARDILAGLAAVGEKHEGWTLRDSIGERDRFARMGIKTDNELRLALTEYVIHRAGAKSEDPIKKAERELVGFKGIDFFPTPRALVDELLSEADIKPGMKVLEPSAGKGDIADALRAAGADVDCVEISQPPRAILEAKGHRIVGSDFEEFEPPPGGYDRIVMNPPFGNRMDATHTRRAYDMLKPGGRLVSITGAGLGFGKDQAATEFRAWLEEHGGTSTPLPEGSFKSAFRPTGVATRLVVVDKPADAPAVGPQEGDTKTEDGVAYVLRDSRWHRAEPEPSAPADAPAEPDAAPEPAAPPTFSEAMQAAAAEARGEPVTPEAIAGHWGGGSADDVLDQLHARPDDHAMTTDGRWQRMEDYAARPDRADEVARLADAIATSTDDTSRARWKRQLRLLADGMADQPGGQRPAAAPDDLDPSSPNYRYRDTGYIGGSRKEMAAAAIKTAARTGARVRATDVDWTELEQNPREAAALITKSNLFGAVDWEAMREAGVEPGAGFLLSRIYAAVGTEPAEDNAAGRRDYAVALDSLRDRAEACRSVKDVADLLAEIRNEREGVTLTAEEQQAYDKLTETANQAFKVVRDFDNQAAELSKQATMAAAHHHQLRREVEKREARKWAVPAEMRAAADDAKAEAAKAWDAAAEFRKRHGMDSITTVTKTATGVESTFRYPYRETLQRAQAMRQGFMVGVVVRNQRDNPLTRAWRALGTGFNSLVDYRNYKGSEAFGRHMATAKAGKIRDWSWAEKSETTVRGASKRSTRFQLRVADKHERVGGREPGADSTAALKAAFGLRDVQSGHWVLEDPNSAKFHVENAAGALADLADLIGASDSQVAMSGRLAMAFGARGAGSRTGVAHYEPVQRVINITKMAGGGSLAHEWFHFLDNVIGEAATGTAGASDDYATERADNLPPALRGPMRDLMAAMMDGPHRKVEALPYTPAEARWAAANAERGYGDASRVIRNAKSMQEAVDAIEAMHDRGHFGALGKPKTKKQFGDWRKIALIHHAEKERTAAGTPEDEPRVAKFFQGPGMSLFLKDANDLDEGVSGKYWSSPKEMGARAFQAWCQDRLAAQGRKNTYLVSMSDNDTYRKMGLPHRPFPESEERTRILAAFDTFMAAIRDRGDLAKALRLMAA